MRIKLLPLLFFSVLSGTAFSQTLNSSFWVTNGTVNTIVDDNGTEYVGGNFTRVSPATGPAVAFSVHGAGDSLAGFPRVTGGLGLTSQTIRVIVPDGAGGWYIGGNFYYVNGIPDTNIAHINSDFSVDTSWTPDVTGGDVYCIEVHDSFVYVGGAFTKVSTIAKSKLACVNRVTGAVMGLKKTFLAAATIIKTIAATDNNLYIGGTFTSVDGIARKAIAGINISNPSDSGTVTTWDPGNVGGCANTQANTINALLLSGNTIYAAGVFDTLGGCGLRRNIVQLDTTTALHTAWRPWFSGATPATTIMVDCMELKGDTLFAGGNFDIFNGQAGTTKIVAINTVDTGTVSIVSNNISAGVGNHIYDIAQRNDTIFLAGNFISVGGQNRNFLAAVGLTSNFTTNWDPNPNQAPVYALAISGDTIFAGGAFTGIGGLIRNRVFRYDANTGVVDPSWAPNIATANTAVNAIAVSNLTVYLGGNFTTCNGTRNRIVEIPKAGSGLVNTAWGTQISGSGTTISVNAMVLSPTQDTLFIGGNFTATSVIFDHSFKYIAALNTNANSPYDWNQLDGADGIVSSLALKGNQLYAGGAFNNVNGVPRKRLVRLLTDVASGPGVVDAWNPGPTSTSGTVYSLALSNNGILYAGGSFAALQGRSYLAAISAVDTGLIISSFNANLNSAGYVKSVYLKDDSLLYIGGAFTYVQTLSYNRAAVVSGTTGTPYQWYPNINYIQNAAIANCMVNSITEGNGTIFLGGAFLSAGLQFRPVSNLVGFTGTCLGTFLDAGSNGTICLGNNVQLNATPGLSTYSWSPTNGLSDPHIDNPTSSPLVTTIYTVTATNISGCTNIDFVTVTVNALPTVPTITCPSYTPPTSDTIYKCPGDIIDLKSSIQNQYLWSDGETVQTIHVSAAGNYSVTVTNTNGCSNTSGVTTVITLPSPPPAVVTLLSPVGTDTWATTDCSASAYQWYYSTSYTGTFAAIAGADSCSYNLHGEGCLYVIVSDGGATTCQSISSDTVCTVSIDEISVDNEWNVFPNPTQGNSSVSVMLSQSTEISIDVFNVLGSKVLTLAEGQRISAGEQYGFPVKLENAGVYFVVMKYGNGKNSVKRIVKN